MNCRTIIFAALAAAFAAVLALPGAAWGQDEPVLKSDPEALKALKKAESRIYSPLDEGLETLCFDQILGFPGLKKAWITTRFRSPESAAFDVRLEEGIPNPEFVRTSLLKTGWRNHWGPLGIQLGRPLGCAAGRFAVAFAEDGDPSRILLTPRKETALAMDVKSITCTVSGEGLLENITVDFFKGTTVSQAYSFKKFKDTELLLVDTVEQVLKTPFGDQTTKLVFNYEEIEGFHFVTSISTKVSSMNREMESKMVFVNFKVNEDVDPAVLDGDDKKGKETEGESKEKEAPEKGGSI